jgi:hypothetical protein
LPTTQPWISPTTLAVAVCVVVAVVTLTLGPAIALAVALLVVLGILILRRPDVTALLIVLWVQVDSTLLKYLPFRNLGLLIPDAASAMLLAAVALRATTKPQIISRRTIWFLLVPGGLLLLAAGLSWIVNRTPIIDTLYWVRVWLRFVPVALVASLEPWHTTIRRHIFLVVGLTVLIQGLAGVAEYVKGYTVAHMLWPGQFSLGAVQTQTNTLTTATERLVVGTTGHYNILALCMLLSAGALAGSLLARPGDLLYVRMERHPAALLLLLFALATVLISQSRQGAASVVLFAVLGSFFFLRNTSLKRMATAFLLLAAATLAITLGGYVLAAPLMRRLGELRTTEFWHTFALSRGYSIDVVRATFRASPVFGMGPGSFGHSVVNSLAIPSGVSRLGLNPQYAFYVIDVGWADLFAQLGLFGVAALALIPAYLVAVLFRKGHDVSLRVLAAAMLAFLVVGMTFSTPLTYKSTSGLFWLVLGLAVTGRSETSLHNTENQAGLISTP